MTSQKLGEREFSLQNEHKKAKSIIDTEPSIIAVNNDLDNVIGSTTSQPDSPTSFQKKTFGMFNNTRNLFVNGKQSERHLLGERKNSIGA